MANRCFITGDKHGDFDTLFNFIDKMKLIEDDIIIVAGDMGLYWDLGLKRTNHIIDFYENNYKCQLWFIDGNHENFDHLAKLETKDGIFKYVSEHIKYIPRGTTLYVDNKLILCLGGADSIDKFRRKENISWWKQEQITEKDIEKAAAPIQNITVNYVITHACPLSILEDNKFDLCTLSFDLDEDAIDHTSEDRLEELKNRIQFNKWIFAHYHTDKIMESDPRFRCVFNDFIEL